MISLVPFTGALNMGLQSNLLRRGATYAWRKRLPVNLGDGLIQISLRTNDPKIAKRVAAVVSAESTHIFDSMKTNALSKSDARRLLTAVIERELAPYLPCAHGVFRRTKPACMAN
jgi:hypothetical protein